ncbi:unnamed protein product [Polarella glacialis]|uniref:Uncharacterized protein n=1 Tax=Polarella glacialis TaxID=89957 RepID=A0A813FN06_POLGL|nr:unnamed protein product [Polarella glacialis]
MAESQQASALKALQQVAATAIPPGEVVVIPGDASTAAVMQAPVDNKPVTLSAGKADETGFTPAVEVPAAVLQDISAGGKPVVLVMGFMPDDMVSVLDSASSPPASPLASSPPRPKMASKPLSITLFDDEGKPLPKGMKLKEPILLTLQRNASAGATCAFWDVEAGAWSVEGVTRVQSSPGEFEMLEKSPMLVNECPPVFDYAVLHRAVIDGNLEVVGTLINRYHADPDVLSRYGEKALEMAKNLGHKDLYCILARRGGTDHKQATSWHEHHHHSHHHHQLSFPSSAAERPTALVPNDPQIEHWSVLPGQVH